MVRCSTVTRYTVLRTSDEIGGVGSLTLLAIERIQGNYRRLRNAGRFDNSPCSPTDRGLPQWGGSPKSGL